MVSWLVWRHDRLLLRHDWFFLYRQRLARCDCHHCCQGCGVTLFDIIDAVSTIYASGSQTPARQLVNPAARLCCLFLFLIICMWQYETCLNFITFWVIKKFQTNCKWSKIRLRLHQKASITPEASRARLRALDPGRKGLRARDVRFAHIFAPLQKQFWPFQVALESHPALLRKSLRTPDLCPLVAKHWSPTRSKEGWIYESSSSNPHWPMMNSQTHFLEYLFWETKHINSQYTRDMYIMFEIIVNISCRL